MILAHKQDIKTIFYLLAGSLILILQWNMKEFNVFLYSTYIIFSISISAINHNHSHIPIWNNKYFNALTDYWIIIFQGHPVFLFKPTHIDNHHAYCNSNKDYTHTWRYKDDNNLSGFIKHPFSYAKIILKLIPIYFTYLYKNESKIFIRACQQYIFLFFYLACVLYIDIWKGIMLIIIPQFISLFFLLSSNYLQHAHTNENCRYNNSRNFLGITNLFLFNMGYHTAHHLWPNLHWSYLPGAHKNIEYLITPELKQKSLINYILYRYFLAIFNDKYASKPLRKVVG